MLAQQAHSPDAKPRIDVEGGEGDLPGTITSKDFGANKCPLTSQTLSDDGIIVCAGWRETSILREMEQVSEQMLAGVN